MLACASNSEWAAVEEERGGVSERRPVVKASTESKDSSVLAGTQRSLAFSVKVIHVHMQEDSSKA